MNFPIIYFPWMKVNGMALCPFILISKKEFKNNAVLIRHELIHIRQQLELLILPFYICYLANYFYNLIKYKNHYKAYLNIVFEKEAYANDKNENYIKKRGVWAFMNYF